MDGRTQATIRDAARRRRLVLMTYTKQEDGSTNRYNVEPYEFTPTHFWGFDVESGHIKQFILDRIRSAQIVETKRFVPRFPVKIK